MTFPVEATKFACRPAFASEGAQALAIARRLREACKDVWTLLDALGPHASDEQRLEVLRGPQFESAVFSVRAALIFSKSIE